MNGFSQRSVGEDWQKKRASAFRAQKPSSGSASVAHIVQKIVRAPVVAFYWILRKKEEKGTRGFLFWVAKWLTGAAAVYLLFIWFTLPNLNDPTILRADLSTVIVDRNGTELYRLFNEEDRTILPSDQIPDNVRHAMVAIEDERFYTRGCLDIRALLRAVLSFGRSGGASTLTRQLARNALGLQKQNVITRKLKELVLGCQLEVKYSKNDLLDLYLNWIPFGQNAYGVEQASKRFFGISAKDLSLAQAAVLASLPQSPSYLSPYGRHVHTTVSDAVLQKIIDGTITSTDQITTDDVTIGLLGGDVGTGKTLVYVGGRTDQVLSNMKAQGYITEEEETKALSDLKKMVFKKNRESIRAAHFVLWVRDQAEQLLGTGDQKGILEQGGLTIETTLDWEVQQAAEKAVSTYKDTALKLYEAHNISLMAMDPQTREILAYIGNTDYTDEVNEGKVDMVQAPRQPGSSFKPFSYAAAFMQGYNPATPLYDVQTKFGEDIPSNFDGQFWGLMTARSALGASRNVPAIKAFFLGGGEDAVLDLSAKMGVPTPRNYRGQARLTNPDFGFGWPLAIGAGEAPLFEMVQGYATFANAGVYKPAVSIRKIVTSKGAILYQAEDKPEDEVQVLDPRIAYQVTSILSDVSARPTEFWQQGLTIPGTEAAAKTGTSNKCLDKAGSGTVVREGTVCKKRKPSDLWTLGYTPTLAAGVWVGNAKSTALSDRAESLSIASPIWKHFMSAAQKVRPPTKIAFDIPEGIVQPQISLLSGQLPTDCTPIPARAGDVFLQEHGPSEQDPACVKLLVDKVTGLLASDACPIDAQEERSFLMPMSVAPQRWPLWEKGVQDWAEQMRKRGSGAVLGGGTGRLLLPLAPKDACDPSLTPGRLVKPTLDLTFPAAGDTLPYPAFRPKFTVSVGSMVKEIHYAIDGQEIAVELSKDIRTPIRVPRSINKEGNHELTVTLIDAYFNKATATVRFQFGEDTGVPEIRFISPQAGMTFKTLDTLSMSANASDAQGSVKYVEFFLDDTLLARRAREPYGLEYPLKDVAPGTHILRAVATDESGKTGEDEAEITVE